MEQQITNNQIAVMIEELRSKFDILIEGQMSIDQRLRIVEAKVDKLQETVDRHTEELEVIKVIITEHSSEIKGIKTDIRSIEVRLDTIGDRLDKMDNRLENLENQKKEYEQRVDLLETRIANIEKILKK
jgi:chromosome segregation ATPase